MLPPNVHDFWKTLPRPIMGLSPMDGVTDAPFRAIQARHGNPSVIFTEFTAVEGLRAGAVRLLEDFRYSGLERPVVAQLYGADPQAFFGAAVIACALGFDGIDINMGCPAKSVTHRGAGAGLIRDPERAAEIIRQTKRGAHAWAEGISLQEAGVAETVQKAVTVVGKRTERPVSVKTRTGYASPEISTWIPHLLEQGIAALTLHGRTLKQLYSGQADWGLIGQAATYAQGYGTAFLGNGDVGSLEDATEKTTEYGLDGVLVGRSAMGNPWLFRGREGTENERRDVALEHARLHFETYGEPGFVRIRKHLLDYTKGLPNAKELRGRLARVSTVHEVEELLVERGTVAV